MPALVEPAVCEVGLPRDFHDRIATTADPERGELMTWWDRLPSILLWRCRQMPNPEGQRIEVFP